MRHPYLIEGQISGRFIAVSLLLGGSVLAYEVMTGGFGDYLPGGKGDGKRPEDFDRKELRMGVRVEMEHTDDPLIAQEIAMDHLSEDPHYYTKLRTVHLDFV